MTPAARSLGKHLRLGYVGVLLALGAGLGIAGLQMGDLFGHDADHANLIDEAGRQRFLAVLTVHKALLADLEPASEAPQAFAATLAAWSDQQTRVAVLIRSHCEAGEQLCRDFVSMQQRQAAVATLARTRVGSGPAPRDHAQALEAALGAYLVLADHWVADLSSRLAGETINQKRLIRGWMLIMFVAATALFLFVLEPIIRHLQQERSRFDTIARERQRLAAVVENIHDAVAVTDQAGMIQWVNAGFVRLTGFSVEEALTRTGSELLQGPRTDPEALAAMERGFATGSGFRGEILHYDRNGRAFWGSVECTAVCDTTGTVTGFIAIESDVTARREAQVALHQSEQQLRMITAHIPAPISVLDADLAYRFANEAYRDWFGVDPVALTGTTVAELYGAAVFADIEPGLRRALCGETVAEERLIQARDGARYCQLVLVPHRNADGGVVGLFAIHTDITARKEIEVALERQRAFLAATSRVAGVGGWEVDLVSRAVVWSEETCRIHGVNIGYQPKLDEAINFYAPEARPLIQAAVELGIRGGEDWDLELPFIRETGERIWVRAVGEVEFRDGAPVRLRGAFQDITQRKLIEQQRKSDAEALQRLNTELDQFVYAASHDLRSPLRAVAFLATWILDDDPSVKAQTSERLKLIHNRVQRMMRMLDDILDYAQLGRQGRQAGPSVSAATLAAEVVAALDVPGGFLIDIHESLRAIKVARIPLFQVLHNLLGNALKHHDEDAGLIAVSVVETAHWYRFAIEDDGPGVPEAFRAKIFEMFATLKPRDQQEGCGMGLAMVKKIVTQHGGSCGVESASARGATFWFEWPKNGAPDHPPVVDAVLAPA